MRIIEDYLKQLASKSSTPGGGAVLGVSGAQGAALIQMISELSLNHPKSLLTDDELKEIHDQANQLQIYFEQSIEDDIVAFQQVMDAYQLPKTDQTRLHQLNHALMQARDVAYRMGISAYQGFKYIQELLGKSNPWLISDLGIASSLFYTVIEGAYLTIKINEQSLSEVINTQWEHHDVYLSWPSDALKQHQNIMRIVNEHLSN